MISAKGSQAMWLRRIHTGGGGRIRACWLVAIASLLWTGGAAASMAQSAGSNKQIIAYVFPRDRVMAGSEITGESLTRINYAFANIAAGRMVEGSAVDAANFAMLGTLRQRNPSLQLMVSVGGWSWSGGFSDVALTRESRAMFADSVVAFLTRYRLDGLDIDWEYPGQSGAGNRFRAEDGSHFTLLLEALRARFDEQAKRTHKRWLLSIAAGASDGYLAHTEMSKDQLYLDTVNLMAYDYYEPGDSKLTGNHAPLYTDPADPRALSADRSVRAFEQAGVPARKLVLGVPFYGHVWGDVPATQHGLFQTGVPVPNAFASYSAIVTTMLGQGYTRYWDEAAAVPFLYNEAQHQFVSFEDPESLRRKCAYALQGKLAGVMFWDYSSDSNGVLLNTLHAALGGAAGAGAR